MTGKASSLSILRTLYRELRPSVNSPQKHVYETQVWRYIVGLCRYCKTQPSSVEVQKHLEQTGRSYVYYLQGTREYHRISDEYKGAGERSAQETAKLLGFKMPHEVKDEPNKNKCSSTSASVESSRKSNDSNEKGNTNVSTPKPNLNSAVV